jgi:hypothetical protein
MQIPISETETPDDEFVERWVDFCRLHALAPSRQSALRFNLPLMHQNRSYQYLVESGRVGLDMLLRSISGDWNRRQVTRQFFDVNSHLVLRTADAVSPVSGRQVGGAILRVSR